VVRKVAAPKPKLAVHQLAVRGRRLHRIVAKAHHHSRPTLVAVAAAPKRCVVLHSQRLSRANLAYGVAPPPASALDVPPSDVPQGETPPTGVGGGGDEGGGGGGAAFSNPVTGGAAGGGVTVIPTRPPPATPEPQTWMLTILAIGLCGAALRRARAKADAEAG